jgi:predicted O-linked N-acetylglucosamine transferase (SPINDLY family)
MAKLAAPVPAFTHHRRSLDAMPDPAAASPPGLPPAPGTPALATPALGIPALLVAAARAGAAGRPAAQAEHLAAALDRRHAGETVPRAVHAELAAVLLRLRRHAEAERRLRTALAGHPRDADLHNLLGLALRHQGRAAEALAAFDTAARLDPASDAPRVNRVNLHLSRFDGAAAAAALTPLLRRAPKNAEYHRMMGAAQNHLGATERALRHYARARALAPAIARHWTEPALMLERAARTAEALTLLGQALAANPHDQALAQAHLSALRRNGQPEAALALAESLVERLPASAWPLAELARTVMPTDRRRANAMLRAALAIEPDSPALMMELADSLDRTRGPDEGENIDAAYHLARRRMTLGGDLAKDSQILRNILHRACDFATAARLGSFERLGERWSASGQVAALHYHMAQVRTPAQRRLLVEYHRRWGRTVDAAAAQTPLAKAPLTKTPLAAPAVRSGPAKLRLGLMSSDLRNHPVSYFALPLIEGYDRDRFELYCYSWSTGPVDAVQTHIAARVDGFRHAPAIADRDAAQLIADDRLDMLFELGGTTYMNKLRVMAWRPARLQASWLGYPHSAGPETIDHILVDPHIRPEDPALLIERPFQLARSWVVLGRLGFNDRVAIEPGLPSARAGHVTFGTMNNPYKYTPESLALWARITAAVDGAHFLFVRPEGATEAFRANIRAIFAAHGVPPERVEFEAVRGTHLPHYNRIDVALDTFPQTGGTTTCEALWMGVPTVTLVGEAFYERLSHSNLINAGLPGLSCFSHDAYRRTAIELAADTGTRALWRHGLRAQIRRNPLGRADWFVDDFQSTVRRAVDALT